jgi:CHAT domain-containing protein
VHPALEGRRIGALVVVPGGALRTIPFAALRDRATGEFLIEKVPVAVAPGLTLVDPRPIDRESVLLLAAGITESVHGFSPLPFVAGEIQAVSVAFPGEILIDEAFSEARFESELKERPFRIGTGWRVRSDGRGTAPRPHSSC